MLDNNVKQVLEYLSARKQSERNFIQRYLNGDCYKLARELTNRFGGLILMNEYGDHVVARIFNKMFDANGLISMKHAQEYHIMTNTEHQLASTWEYHHVY